MLVERDRSGKPIFQKWRGAKEEIMGTPID
jgi:hypothetical protein